MEAIRILHIIGNVCKGGVESVVFNYYRAIAKILNNNIRFDFVIDDDSPNEIPQDIIDIGCTVYKIPSYNHLPAYMKALKNIFVEGDYKIVHSHMNTLSVFAMAAAKSAGVPIRIAHNHSTAGKGEFKRNVLKYMLRPLAKIFPTHLFACSEYAGRWLFGNRAFNKGKVTVIKNAIDTEKFKFNVDTRERVRHDLKISDRFVVAHVGRFMAQKNHAFLIDIFAEVHRQNKNSVLLLVGDGKLLDNIKTKVVNLGLSDSVIFLGARDDVNELYQAMDVFLFPSLYEGLGLVAVEAQTAGVFSVMSTEVPEEAVLSDKSAVRVGLNENVEIWSDKFNSSIVDKAGMECITVKAGFDINAEAEKLLNSYGELNVQKIKTDVAKKVVRQTV